jgi:hypothetical protein
MAYSFLDSCTGPTVVRELLLVATIAAQEALLPKLFDLPHQHALLVLRQCVQQNLRATGRFPGRFGTQNPSCKVPGTIRNL